VRPCSAVTLDIAWLPPGLTCLKLTGISLSCDGCKTYIESKGAGYAALLLQVRVMDGISEWSGRAGRSVSVSVGVWSTGEVVDRHLLWPAWRCGVVAAGVAF
jgi:hypothetical protein